VKQSAASTSEAPALPPQIGTRAALAFAGGHTLRRGRRQSATIDHAPLTVERPAVGPPEAGGRPP